MTLDENGVAKGFLQYRGSSNGVIPNTIRLMTQSGSNADMIFGTNAGTDIFIAGGQNGLTRGNIGIGTTNPPTGYKLAVAGKIISEEIVVKLQADWPDHVFEENYNLPTLNQVESFIKENKHLPDIPSAKEVEKEGLSMAEMMKKQMQKIEELTLYVIELKKENDEMKKENDEIKQKLEMLMN